MVIIDGAGHLTMDAMDWLASQGVTLIRLRWDGQFTSVVSSGGQAASSQRIRWQQATRDDPKARVQFALDLIRQKARNSLATMETHVPCSRVWHRAYANMSAWTDTLHKSRPPASIGDLFGIEGPIAADYFRAWSGIEMKWRATKKDAIPEDWRRFTSRSALRPEVPRNHRATHPINAMLNYAYGILMARTHIDVMTNGYDPNLGIMHDDIRTRVSYPKFVLDCTEPMRPIVDRAPTQ